MAYLKRNLDLDMDEGDAETLLLNASLSPSAKSKALLNLKKDQLKECVTKRNLSTSGTKQDLVSLIHLKKVT